MNALTQVTTSVETTTKAKPKPKATAKTKVPAKAKLSAVTAKKISKEIVGRVQAAFFDLEEAERLCGYLNCRDELWDEIGTARASAESANGLAQQLLTV